MIIEKERRKTRFNDREEGKKVFIEAGIKSPVVGAKV